MVLARSGIHFRALITTWRLVVFAVLLLQSTSLANASGAPFGRILGGDESLIGALPHVISLRIDNTHVCGGCIIAENKILTAAHCVHRDNKLVSTNRFSARVGSTNQYAGGRIATIASVSTHPDYYKLTNNLAVLTLTQPLAWTERIRPIEIATAAADIPTAAAEVKVAGWGNTVEGNMSFRIREILLRVASEEVCKDAYSAHDAASFCLAHPLQEGTCHGDGGGGAVYNNKLIGIVNFVIGACGSRYPDVFVNVAHYAQWINSQ